MDAGKDKAMQEAYKRHLEKMNVAKASIRILLKTGASSEFRGGYEARSAQSDWVKITDPIVETWKDGQPVWLFHKNGQSTIPAKWGQAFGSTREWVSLCGLYHYLEHQYSHVAPINFPNPPKEQ